VVGRDDQPETGDGQRGRYRVAERPAVPGRPGNAGRGKGPQFKVGAESSEVSEIGATLVTPQGTGAAEGVTCSSEGSTQVPPGKRVCARVVGGTRGCPQPACEIVRHGQHGPVLVVSRTPDDLPWAMAWCLVREPDVVVPPVRFDERDVETGTWLG